MLVFEEGGEPEYSEKPPPTPREKTNNNLFIYSFVKDSPSCLAGMSATEHHVPYQVEHQTKEKLVRVTCLLTTQHCKQIGGVNTLFDNVYTFQIELQLEMLVFKKKGKPGYQEKRMRK